MSSNQTAILFTEAGIVFRSEGQSCCLQREFTCYHTALTWLASLSEKLCVGRQVEITSLGSRIDLHRLSLRKWLFPTTWLDLSVVLRPNEATFPRETVAGTFLLYVLYEIGTGLLSYSDQSTLRANIDTIMAKMNNDVWLSISQFLDVFDHCRFSSVSSAFRSMWTSRNQKVYELWSSIFETEKWLDHVKAQSTAAKAQSTAAATPRPALMGRHLHSALHRRTRDRLYLVLLLGEHGEYYDDDQDKMLRTLINSLRLTPEERAKYLNQSRYPTEIVLHPKGGKTIVLNVAQVLDIGSESNTVPTERVFTWSRSKRLPQYKVDAPVLYHDSKEIEMVQVSSHCGRLEPGYVFAINPTDKKFRGYLQFQNYQPGFHNA